MLAYPCGRPSITSSYRFDNSDQGPTSDGNHQTQNALAADRSSCAEGWIREHRLPGIAGMIGFRNVTHQTDVRHTWSNGADQVAFARGHRGFFAINRASPSSVLEANFQADLRPGRCCNVYPRTGAACRTCPRQTALRVQHLPSLAETKGNEGRFDLCRR